MRARILTSLLFVALAANLATASTPRKTPSRPASKTHAREVMNFIADDYTRAVAEARARRVPLFIEAWAPW